MTEICIRNERLQLFAERAVYWVRTETLLIADTHWGKAATMRATGIPIPGGTTTADMDRLTALLERTGARRMVLLGDVIHAKAGRAPKTLASVMEWRGRHPALEMVMVRGNHDRHAGDPPAALRMECVDAPKIEAPFVFQHFPAPSQHGYALAGHTHPAYRVHGRAGERATVACFHFTRTHGTLPAFGALTGCALVSPDPDDELYGIAGDEVIPL